MSDLQWYLLQSTQTETPVVFRGQPACRPRPVQDVPPSPAAPPRIPRAGGRRSVFSVLRAVLGSAAVLALVLLAALWGSPAAAAARTAASPALELGAAICAPYGRDCIEQWEAGVAQGTALTLLMSDVCLAIYANETDFAGVDCLDRAIHVAASAPAAVVAEVLPGLRDDPAGRLVVAVWLESVITDCDQTTPDIRNYFGCLRERLLTPQVGLRRLVMN